MNMIWQPNPLATIVELTPQEIELFRAKLRIDDLEDKLAGVCVHLEEGQFYDLDMARREAKSEDVGHVEELVDFYLNELKLEHCGDCTCVPSSCAKCHAEYLMSIDTIAGLGKHRAHLVSSQFHKGRSLDGVIASLENYAPVRGGSWLSVPVEQWDECIPHWRRQASSAAEWLRVYRAAHFPEPPQVTT